MGRFSFQTQCRARIKTTLCQLFCPFGFIKNSLFFHTLFSAVLSNSFWVQIFFGILLHSAYYR
uniref:Uncharacterized protein n=1 Tax=Rhinopithecus roxellana TaxID=61622 RepID=A0A2K6QDW8_RHIRO